MKNNCPNCGAIIKSNKCKYCGTNFEDDSEETIIYADGKPIYKFSISTEDNKE